ncbi:hypothetical protein U732_12 [Clostridium argentinense CDC 2741]|uniref:Uncharacterized protein n=2 Tax=Clostridium argentinense TaxID=29341 RepID=A0A0C1TYA1_9CLOT|nr:hypothetical protein [Clostridium argentinense]ARC83127.1 hypothetical protein RSJ17_00305 [Clostridium argentinense]KIE44328.1 hypothetical protein U732_12 [Clostridium argentinense CDC 2741]NFF41319.1 hypothetical protein [Clostridium argentinense]NFP51786.1 hypothetical protein [Clostridium argentinense]NFP74244.1 hypothetical protein [Clostridium argentinense]
MKVLEKGVMPNGTHIQIEEWNEDHSFMPYGSMLISYPKSKASHKGSFAPKTDEIYRFEFSFKSEKEAKCAFNDLLAGNKALHNFKENFSSKREYLNCILSY